MVYTLADGTQMTRRKRVTVTGAASGAQANYQINLSALEHEAAMQSGFNDLRFTKSDMRTIIDSWLESKVDDTSADIWIEAPTTPPNGETEKYFGYYGNNTAASDWDIDATFLFGDDFPGSSIDTNKWTGSTGSASVLSGIMTLSATGTWIYIYATNHNAPFACRYLAKMGNSAGNNYDSMVGLSQTSNVRYAKAVSNPFDVGVGKWIIFDSSDTSHDGTFPIPPDYSWYTGDITIDTHNTKCYTDGSLDATSGQAPQNLNPFAGARTGDIYLDWIIMRKYVLNPPTAVLGNEEHQRRTPTMM